MKKIKVLYGLVIALILFQLIRYLYTTAMVVHIPYGIKLRYLISALLNSNLLFIIGMIFIERGLFHSIKKGYFNIKSVNKFKIGGLFILISGFITLAQNVYLLLFHHPLSQEFKNLFLQGVFESIITLIIGISLIVISDFIKRGSQLKKENELTI